MRLCNNLTWTKVDVHRIPEITDLNTQHFAVSVQILWPKPHTLINMKVYLVHKEGTTLFFFF